MPTRSAAARAAEPADTAGANASPNKLQFHESLSWRAGKAIPTGELIRRLETLAAELANTDQEDEEFDKASLVVTAGELAQLNLLTHRDKGVRALTACCLVDILRICAPDAPFDTPKMQGIFDLIVLHIVPLLQDPTDPYNGRHLHVLTSLSEYKSIILLADLPQPERLIVKLFHTCFDILATPGDGLSKNVEYCISGLLQNLVDECETLPAEVVEVILIQFLRADPWVSVNSTGRGKSGEESRVDSRQSQLQLKSLPPAYRAAKNICNSSEERMARLVSQYFSNVILDASASRRKAHSKSKSKQRLRTSNEMDMSDQEGDDEPSEDDLKQLEKAHRLMREIWRCSPGVLQNVVPQVEAELSAENLQLRKIATEAIGDMISGIGAAGPPSPPILDPAAYPALKLSDSPPEPKTNDTYMPSSSRSLAQSHPSAYQNFMGRKNDKSPEIRAAWSRKIGHILSTSAGGLGISAQDVRDMALSLAQLLIDNDENVRIAAIEALALLDFPDFISKLGSLGGVSAPGSLLQNLGDRVKDRKHAVRAKAAGLLGRLWGAGSAEIAAGNEQVTNLLSQVPSTILNSIYANEVDINALVDQVLFDALLPLGYPSLKKKEHASQGSSQRQNNGSGGNVELDADKIRTERLLLVSKDLDPRAKSVLLSLMARPMKLSVVMKLFLRRCEDYNGGVMDEGAVEIKQHLSRLIDHLAKSVPDHSKAAEDLWKFAKIHDRRCYSLIRFCMADDSDYQKIFKSYKEFKRRLDSLPSTTPTLPQTLTLLLCRVSNWFYNRSHIRPIMELAKDAQNPLASAAHELLKDISAKNPGAFKAHGQELCTFLEEHAPRKGRGCDTGTLDALKACVSFTSKYPDDLPKERKFMQAIVQYAIQGSPATAAKYAVSIILSSKDRKEMYVKDVLRKCVQGFSYGADHFMARLASLSQLMMVASTLLDETENIDPVLDIAIDQVLSQTRTTDHGKDAPREIDASDEGEAKTWALKILANRLRSYDDAAAVGDISEPVYRLLNNVIVKHGELDEASMTPPAQKSRLRLHAALLHLKLCSHRDFDTLLTPKMFNDLAVVVQDSEFRVREQFVTKIKKYLGQNRLPSRFYAIVFLVAFEPERKLQRDTLTWLRARANALAQAKKPTMELLLARFLSLLAHHPDFNHEFNNSTDTDSQDELQAKVQYIMYFLQAVATAENLALLYHVAQRVKSVQDGIDPDKSDNLYFLADLTVAIITHYANVQNWSLQENWSLQAHATKIKLPTGIFAALTSHDAAQEIATKQYLPAEDFEEVEDLVKASMKSKKRKSDDEPDAHPRKRTGAIAKNSTGAKGRKSLPARSRKTDSKKPTTNKAIKKTRAANGDEAPSSVERRRSGRGANPKSYAERDETQDDEEMETWNQVADLDENPSSANRFDRQSSETLGEVVRVEG